MTEDHQTPEERIDQYLLGQATPEDIEVLNELLANDAQLRKLYRFHVAIEGGYREAAVRDENLSPITAASSQVAPMQSTRRRYLYGFALAAASLAAAILVVLAFQSLGRRETPTLKSPNGARIPVARLVTSLDSTWREIDPAPGAFLEKGRFDLESGIVELEFNRGARVTVRGPSSFELKSTDLMHVTSGNLIARIPEEAIGFTIETDKAEVVDLGTEFGLRVGDQGQTEVHVIEGLVEVFKRDGPNHRSSRSIRIEEGQAIRMKVDAADEFEPEDIPVRSSRGVLGNRKLDNLGLTFLQGNIRLKEAVSKSDLKREATSWIEVIPEKRNILLDQAIPVTLIKPGNYRVFGDSGRTISAGKKVDSFLVHFRSTQPEPIHAVIKFDRKIIGIVCEASQLNATDSILGREGVDYPASTNQYRGLDPHLPNDNPDFTRGGGWTPDSVTVSKDMQTLGLSVNVVPTGRNSQGVDQLRILVSSEEKK